VSFDPIRVVWCIVSFVFDSRDVGRSLVYHAVMLTHCLAHLLGQMDRELTHEIDVFDNRIRCEVSASIADDESDYDDGLCVLKCMGRMYHYYCDDTLLDKQSQTQKKHFTSHCKTKIPKECDLLSRQSS
jgi:hypothetical protein